MVVLDFEPKETLKKQNELHKNQAQIQNESGEGVRRWQSLEAQKNQQAPKLTARKTYSGDDSLNKSCLNQQQPQFSLSSAQQQQQKQQYQEPSLNNQKQETQIQNNDSLQPQNSQPTPWSNRDLNNQQQQQQQQNLARASLDSNLLDKNAQFHSQQYYQRQRQLRQLQQQQFEHQKQQEIQQRKRQQYQQQQFILQQQGQQQQQELQQQQESQQQQPQYNQRWYADRHKQGNVNGIHQSNQYNRTPYPKKTLSVLVNNDSDNNHQSNNNTFDSSHSVEGNSPHSNDPQQQIQDENLQRKALQLSRDQIKEQILRSQSENLSKVKQENKTKQSWQRNNRTLNGSLKNNNELQANLQLQQPPSSQFESPKPQTKQIFDPTIPLSQNQADTNSTQIQINGANEQTESSQYGRSQSKKRLYSLDVETSRGEDGHEDYPSFQASNQKSSQETLLKLPINEVSDKHLQDYLKQVHDQQQQLLTQQLNKEQISAIIDKVAEDQTTNGQVSPTENTQKQKGRHIQIAEQIINKKKELEHSNDDIDYQKNGTMSNNLTPTCSSPQQTQNDLGKWAVDVLGQSPSKNQMLRVQDGLLQSQQSQGQIYQLFHQLSQEQQDNKEKLDVLEKLKDSTRMSQEKDLNDGYRGLDGGRHEGGCELVGDVRIALFKNESCRQPLFNYWINMGCLNSNNIVANVLELDRPLKPLSRDFKLELKLSDPISGPSRQSEANELSKFFDPQLHSTQSFSPQLHLNTDDTHQDNLTTRSSSHSDFSHSISDASTLTITSMLPTPRQTFQIIQPDSRGSLMGQKPFDYGGMWGLFDGSIGDGLRLNKRNPSPKVDTLNQTNEWLNRKEESKVNLKSLWTTE